MNFANFLTILDAFLSEFHNNFQKNVAQRKSIGKNYGDIICKIVCRNNYAKNYPEISETEESIHYSKEKDFSLFNVLFHASP